MSGWVLENARISTGTNDSAAVVTAAIRSTRCACGGRLLRGAATLLQESDHVGRERRECASGGRRSHAAPFALQQRRIEFAGERSISCGHGRLGHDELVRRGRDRAGAYDGEEAPELRQRDRQAARIIEEILMVPTHLLLAFESSSGMLPS